MLSYQLPVRDDLGFCNMLISAFGGDGANMADKLLFKIGFEEFGLDGGYDAKYGSEKKDRARRSVGFVSPCEGIFVGVACCMLAKQGAWLAAPQIQAPWCVSVSLTPEDLAKYQVRATNGQPLRDFAQQAWHIAQLSFHKVGPLVPTPGIVTLQIFFAFIVDKRSIRW